MSPLNRPKEQPPREKFALAQNNPQVPAKFSDDACGGIFPPKIMKRPATSGIYSLKALGAMLALGAMAHAGNPYLPLIGPPPLRILAVKSPAATTVKFQATPVTATNSPLVIAA